MLSDRAALSRASHELRTPLQAILGFSQLLALDSLNESQRHSVEQIIAGGRHLLALIEDLLDLSGVGELSSDLVDVGDEIAHAVSLCRPLVAERSLTVNLDLPREPTPTVTDRRRLKQILLNLISNAIKYNRAGGTLTVRASTEDQDIRIDVIDTGRGMTGPELDRLFVPFERLDAAHRGIEGNGLGLAVSKMLAEAMDGTIEAASTPGQGSAFTLRLPLVVAHVSTVAPRGTTGDAGRGRRIRHVAALIWRSLCQAGSGSWPLGFGRIAGLLGSTDAERVLDVGQSHMRGLATPGP